MTPLRLAIDANHRSMDMPRDSMCVNRAAEILACDQSYVRKLIRRGRLEAYRIGRRGVRVFADSVRTYQETNRIAASGAEPTSHEQVKKLPWRSGPHREAMNFLQQSGVI